MVQEDLMWAKNLQLELSLSYPGPASCICMPPAELPFGVLRDWWLLPHFLKYTPTIAKNRELFMAKTGSAREPSPDFSRLDMKEAWHEGAMINRFRLLSIHVNFIALRLMVVRRLIHPSPWGGRIAG
jgi:hypothetical protein